MGDISDMMLDGTLCEQCGEYIDDDEGGFPRLCAACNQDDEIQKREPKPKKKGGGK